MSNNEVFVCLADTAKLVRLSRIARGWRQVDLAAISGVTQGEVSQLERGIHVIPAVRKRVLKVLDLDAGEESAKKQPGGGE